MSHVYRHKFGDETIEQMNYFAKLHAQDDRVTFKEAWERWVINNSTIIELETDRHRDAGYNGDIVDKMYKSVRYYYRKKNPNDSAKEEQKRRNYVALDRNLLRAMDKHIESNITIKPSVAFDDFCENNKDILTGEIIRLKSVLSGDEISIKIKKTYKNRHFNALKQ